MKYSNTSKKIYSMVLPIILESFLIMMAEFVSMAMVGRIDVFAVGAKGLSARITGTIICLFKGVSTGAIILIARAYGAEDSSKIRKVSQQTLVSIVGLIIVMQQIIYWNAPILLKVFDPKPEMMAKSIMYMRTVSWGLPMSAIMMVVTSTLQGMGNAITPLKITIIMNLTNIFCSYMLIFGNFGFSSMGLIGSAYALVIAQFTGASIGLWVLFNKNGVLGYTKIRSFFKIDFKQIYSIFKLGLPTSSESVFWQLSAIILSRVMLSFGEVSFASYQLGLQAEQISEILAVGFGIAATTFIGQSFGAKDKNLGKSYFKEILKGSILFTTAGTFILIFFRIPIMSLLTNNQDVIKLGAVYLLLMGLIQLPQGVQKVFNGALIGVGYTSVPMIVAGVGLWGIRVPLSLILTYYFKLDIVSIWVVICADQICRFILSFIFYKKKDIFVKTRSIE